MGRKKNDKPLRKRRKKKKTEKKILTLFFHYQEALQYQAWDSEGFQRYTIMNYTL